MRCLRSVPRCWSVPPTPVRAPRGSRPCCRTCCSNRAVALVLSLRSCPHVQGWGCGNAIPPPPRYCRAPNHHRPSPAVATVRLLRLTRVWFLHVINLQGRVPQGRWRFQRPRRRRRGRGWSPRRILGDCGKHPGRRQLAGPERFLPRRGHHAGGAHRRPGIGGHGRVQQRGGR